MNSESVYFYRKNFLGGKCMLFDRREVLVERQVKRKNGRVYRTVSEHHPTIKEVPFLVSAGQKGQKLDLQDPAFAKSKTPDWLHTLPEVKKLIEEERAKKQAAQKFKNEMFLEGAKQNG